MRRIARAFALSILLYAPLYAPHELAHAQTTALPLKEFEDSAAHQSREWLAERMRSLHTSVRGDAIRRGIIQLQLAQSCTDGMYADAARSFQAAIKQDSASAPAWSGLGRAKLAEAECARGESLNLGLRVGVAQVDQALVALRNALTWDPHASATGILLAHASEATGDTAAIKAAIPILRRAASSGGHADAALSLSLAQLEEAAGSLDSAMAAYERYLALGGSQSLGTAALARAQLMTGDTSGATRYYLVAGSEDSAAIELIRNDLAYVAPDSVLAAFDSASPGARQDLVRHFWQSRENAELQPSGSRLAEHLLRLRFAKQHFRLTSTKRAYTPRDAYRGRAVGLDDRGVVYVRLGRPDLRLQPMIPHAMPNETWVYRRPGGDLLLHFSSGGDTPRVADGDKFDYGGDISDYHLVNSIMDLHGAQDAPRDLLLASRDSASDLYRKMATYLPVTAAQVRREEREIGARSVKVATTTDDNQLRFRRQLRAEAQVASLGATANGGLVHVVVGVLRPSSEGWTSLRVRFALTAADGSLGARLDSIIEVPLVRQPEPQWILMRIPVTAAAGDWEAHLALSSGDSTGVVLSSGQLRVAGPGDGLRLSSLVLEDPPLGLRWPVAAGDVVYFTPFAVATRASPLRVFYEIDGAEIGRTYRTRISLAKLDSGNEPVAGSRVTIGYTELAGQSSMREHRTIDLRRLRPGRYVLRVQVAGPQGGSVERAKLIVVQ